MGAMSDLLIGFAELVYPDEHRQNILMADIMAGQQGELVSTVEDFRLHYERTGVAPRMDTCTMQKLVTAHEEAFERGDLDKCRRCGRPTGTCTKCGNHQYCTSCSHCNICG